MVSVDVKHHVYLLPASSPQPSNMLRGGALVLHTEQLYKNLDALLLRGLRLLPVACVCGVALSPFFTGRMFVRRTYFGQFDEL